MSDLVIETRHLRKTFGDKVAVHDLTLQVPKGEVFGFLGPNGAGKSTTIKMLLGLVAPTSGYAALLDRPPHDWRARIKIGFLPEDFRFHEWLKAAEFLMFHGQLYGMPAAQIRARIPALLQLVGLADCANQRLSQFSKGMLQRVGLAQAMLNQPELIFLDEPTSGLDPIGRREVRDIIHHLKAQGTTVFLNSHFLSEVEVTCDRVAFIKRGRIVRTDLMADLLNQTTEVTVRVDALSPELLAALALLGEPLQVNGAGLSLRVNDPAVTPEIARTVIAHGTSLYELKPKQRSLEEIFISIIESQEPETV